jgi:hypothetical protein
MNVKELIAKLSTFDGNLPVVFDGVSLGFGEDFKIGKVNKYDNCTFVSLISDGAFEEDEE